MEIGTDAKVFTLNPFSRYNGNSKENMMTRQHPKSKVKHIVILLGPPGSGKGTQAKKIVKALQIPHLSTGDLFRDNIYKDTPLGRKAKSFIDAGQLVPDNVVLDMLFDRTSQADCKEGYLLDGFPRTLSQADAFDQSLEDQVHVTVINLEVPEDVIVKRISGRLVCKKCGHVHNRYYSPPQKEGICDQCGGELVQRSDDHGEVVRQRIAVYKEQTAPLIEHYEKRGKVSVIDGEQDPQIVFNGIMDAIRQ